ncbi:MAG: sigma-54 dependent transcriptional regulator [Ginsengibacter sp.]|jgi:two-component system response regulator HydG
MKKKILIIDDDFDMCTLLSRFLDKRGYQTDVAHNGAKGLAKFSEDHFDIVLCDFRLGDKDGKDVLVRIKELKPKTIVIIITGYSDIKIAVDVIKQGAFDYITKPLIPDEVINVIEKALASPNVEPVVASPVIKADNKIKKSYTVSSNNEYLVGQAGKTEKVYSQIAIVAKTNYSIILYGESGTGKEVIAKTIHESSDRANKPFIAMDCGTLSKELAGSQLFGHVKGAFTGAINDKEGHFEMANGGTLFLDEVSNLSLDVQASLLRVIQERKFKRVGGNKEMDVDVRIIVASNENLQEAYKRGKFREDLYHRFNEFSINLPALRHRKEDIPLFAQFFLDKTNEELGKNIEGYSEDVEEMFMKYTWPGNLREFRNVVRRAVLLTSSGKINSSVLPWEIKQSLENNDNNSNGHSEILRTEDGFKEVDLKDAAAKAEYDTIMAVLKDVNFNKTRAAEILKIDRKTLYNKIKIYESL